jgi:hypothetical protein
MASRQCLQKHINCSLQGIDKGCLKSIDCLKDMDKDCLRKDLDNDRLPERDLQAILMQCRLARLLSLAMMTGCRLSECKTSRFNASTLSTQLDSCHAQEVDKETYSMIFSARP